MVNNRDKNTQLWNIKRNMDFVEQLIQFCHWWIMFWK